MNFVSNRRILTLILAVLAGVFSVARAGVLDDIGGAISSLRGQKARKIGAAQSARAQANSRSSQVDFLHQKLLKTSRLLDEASNDYARAFRRMRATEEKIEATKARAAQISARYEGHKTQFGLRLASMQRHGQTNFLQVALGSLSLADLSRRTTYFQALTERDARLQERLKSDKAEILTSQNALMAQWRARRDAQRDAGRERNRIARGEAEQMQTWKAMNSARYALLSYALQQERALGSIDNKIGDLRSRQSGIIAQNQARIAARERALDEYRAQMARERDQMRAQSRFRARVRRRVVRDYNRSRAPRLVAAPRYRSRTRSYRTRYSRRRYARQPRPQLAPRVGLMPRFAPRVELAPMPIEALQNPAKFTLPMH